MGEVVGETVGECVGEWVGLCVGVFVGETVGDAVGVKKPSKFVKFCNVQFSLVKVLTLSGAVQDTHVIFSLWR